MTSSLFHPNRGYGLSLVSLLLCPVMTSSGCESSRNSDVFQLIKTRQTDWVGGREKARFICIRNRPLHHLSLSLPLSLSLYLSISKSIFQAYGIAVVVVKDSAPYFIFWFSRGCQLTTNSTKLVIAWHPVQFVSKNKYKSFVFVVSYKIFAFLCQSCCWPISATHPLTRQSNCEFRFNLRWSLNKPLESLFQVEMRKWKTDSTLKCFLWIHVLGVW